MAITQKKNCVLKIVFNIERSKKKNNQNLLAVTRNIIKQLRYNAYINFV